MSEARAGGAEPTRGMTASSAGERMDLVVVGHVDHGKSTVIGRLMSDTGSLPEGKLEQVKAMCAKNARPFEYAFLLDALKNEQAQGITIDTARCFFKTPRRHYVIHDAPGHIEFLKNMITGASRAEAALLVIDGHEGVRENSKRHGYILSMLGIRHIAVLVNKMDLLGWEQDAFQRVVAEYSEFLDRLGVHPEAFIPVSAREGVNIAEPAAEMPWYEGPTVLEQVDSFEHADDEAERAFRMPLQDVYKFTAAGDDRRIFAGTIESGRLTPGEEVVFLPSGKRSTVKSIEVLSGEPPAEAFAGQAVGFTLDTQVYARPGELMVRAEETQPHVTQRFRANVFWMGLAPLITGRRYAVRIGAAKVPVELVEVLSVLDASELSSVSGKRQLDRHDVGEVVLETTRPVAFDVADELERTSRFVVVDGYDITGCGTILEALHADTSLLAERLQRREASRMRGAVERSQRLARNGHEGKAVVFVGPESVAAEAARTLEQRLFSLGANAYFLGISEDVDGVRATGALERDEQLSHFGEVARAMADAGLLFIAVLGGVDRYDVERLRLMSAPHELFVAAMGEEAGEVPHEVSLPADADPQAAATEVLRALTAVGVVAEYSI